MSILKRHKTFQNENKLKYGKYYKTSNFACTKENGETITTDTLKYLSRVVNYKIGFVFNFHSLRHTHATRSRSKHQRHTDETRAYQTCHKHGYLFSSNR